MSDTPVPVFADIEQAALRIARYAVRTPLLENPVLNARVGARVFLKPEALQRTGSFKFRGACNRLSAIPEAERKNGVVAFSSGNHAQGVAAAAALFGMPATIVMPADAPRAKLEGTKRLGAKVVTYDRLREDREAIATKICTDQGATLVKPFDDPLVVAGQGTVGLEIAKDLHALDLTPDLTLVPCGGGGLVSGTALALTSLFPGTAVVGVEAEDYDGMGRSLRAGVAAAAPAKAITLADSLMAPKPGAIPFALAKTHLANAITVDDDDLKRAVSFAFCTLKLVVEPGGSAALAALLAGKVDLKGKTVAVVLSGGNVDLDVFTRCCEAYPEP
ncbi:MAG TPA: threonine/serine dehydratase [Rhizomicrobium sp.]|jgi:threonine dehydratase